MHQFRPSLLRLAFCVCVIAIENQPIAAADNQRQTDIPSKQTEVSFGRRQIDQMLKDRPDMVGILKDDDPILVWIIKGMNGNRIGQRIYWSAGSPPDGVVANHSTPRAGRPASIRVTESKRFTGIDRWCVLVFELYNLENSDAFSKLWTEACKGNLDGNTLATKGASLEYVALKKTQKFFTQHPIPNAKAGRNHCYEWHLQIPETFSAYLETFRDAQGQLRHPGKYIQDYYDHVIVPYLLEKSVNNLDMESIPSEVLWPALVTSTAR